MKRIGRGALKGLGRLSGVVGATELGAEAVKSVVEPRAEAAKAARKSYNERASTDMDTAARGVREAMSGDCMRRLQGEGMKKGGAVRGCGRAARGHGKARMIKMKGA